MAVKTYPRFALRVLRPRDPVLGGSSDYYNLALVGGAISDGFPLKNTGGEVEIADAAADPIVGFSLQDDVDKDGAALPAGTPIETFLANDPYQTWLEGNLLSGAAGAQIDHVLAQADMFAPVTLQFDPNYLGAGIPGYYFDVNNDIIGVGGSTGNGRIVSFINTRVPSNEEESYSIPGDTNAVVRVQMQPGEYLLNASPNAAP